ncbi:hypothetical protein BZA05DRAFT_441493 [Tricharina praecox]|uniref:uncharacterized protein n=1 Tax=Tricharina praecox TaxID=43433 RepID=UPI002220F0EF|nr:uncharacterized protein BZA05DRAFT_441493 [Tricharina praecox]KAI5856854.1 hypothetical protein BZA05DRAFT_441493 [Tricharina praecox]
MNNFNMPVVDPLTAAAGTTPFDSVTPVDPVDYAKKFHSDEMSEKAIGLVVMFGLFGAIGLIYAGLHWRKFYNCCRRRQ